MNRKLLSIVVPVYQNELNLPVTIPRLLAVCDGFAAKGVAAEIIFVNDGSHDRSSEILWAAQELNSERIHVVELTRNCGQNTAIQAGLRFAKGDLVGIISSDLQDPPELFHEMFEKWQKGFKLVGAEREERYDSIFSKYFAQLHWYLVSRYAVPGFPNGGFDFCVIDREIVDLVNLINEKNTHIFSLIFSFGFSSYFIPYSRDSRSLGKSQWTLAKKLKLTADIFVAFSYFPVRMVSYFGIAIAFLSFLMAILYVVNYFMVEVRYPGWTSLAVLISLMGGLTLVVLGFIGEYLWRILDQVRRRPQYFVKKTDLSIEPE